jgi:hypothetical protein
MKFNMYTNPEYQQIANMRQQCFPTCSSHVLMNIQGQIYINLMYRRASCNYLPQHRKEL